MPARALLQVGLRSLSQPPASPGRRLAGYYLALGLVGAGAVWLVPGVSDLLMADRLAFLGTNPLAPVGPSQLPTVDPGSSVRFDLQLILVMLVALALMLPTSWVYTATRRTRGYDQAVVQTLLILPLAVAGIIMVVQNSLALAFSLAGVVAAVRFRSTLKDSSDMLYVFLAIAIGLAAGVKAVTAAAILSATFNFVTLAIWQCGVEGCPLSGQEHGHGSARLDGASPAQKQSGALKSPAATLVPGRKKKRRFDAVLSVQAVDLKPAQRVVEEVLTAEARRWQIDEITPKKSGRTLLKYVVRFDAQAQPDLILETLLSRGAPHLIGATLR